MGEGERKGMELMMKGKAIIQFCRHAGDGIFKCSSKLLEAQFEVFKVQVCGNLKLKAFPIKRISI